MKLIQNAYRVLEDKTILNSAHVHDYTHHTTPSGVDYVIDGGTEYLRRSKNPPGTVEDLTINANTPPEKHKDMLVWGTYGKDGSTPFHWVLLKDCETEHLQRILASQRGLDKVRRTAILAILEERGENVKA